MCFSVDSNKVAANGLFSEIYPHYCLKDLLGFTSVSSVFREGSQSLSSVLERTRTLMMLDRLQAVL